MALTALAAREAIQSAFFTVWGSTTPIAWDNDDFDPTKINVPWVRVSIQFSSGSIASIGGVGDRFYRAFGIVFVQIFTLAGSNAKLNDTYAQMAKDVFKGVQLAGGLWFRETQVETVGPDGKWFQQNVSSEFQYDETE
jgi:hypothetical protein